MAVDPTHSPGQALHITPDNVDESDMDVSQMETPAHPVPSMQGAFQESILESFEENEMPPVPVEVDAHARRHRLLEAKRYDDSWIARWHQRPTAQYHPLLKLMAQIVFGMHLLQQQQAKSDKEVVKILQTHVNEVDTFLERTAEDFSVAIRDAEDRIRCLRLPMTHIDVFETMLGDQRFRSQLLTGNEKIERIIERTKRAMKAYLLDVDVGVQANRDLHRFMKRIQDRWPQEQRSIADVYNAMRGNEQGWKRYLRDLQNKGTVLAGLLASLQKLIDDMSKMAADARTKSKIQTATATATSLEPVPALSTPVMPSTIPSPEPASATTLTASPHSPPRRRASNLNKPLPSEPPANTTATQDSATSPHPIPFAERYERPRQSPPEPSSPQHTNPTPSILFPRPKTASDPRQARAADARTKPQELLDFLQRPDPLRSNPNPLRSNPPDESDVSRTSADTNKLSRSTSGGGANLIVGTVGFNQNGAKVTRAVDVMSVKTGNSVDFTRSPSTQQESRGLQSSGGGGGSEARTLSNAEAAEHAERRAAMKNTGFARRLSKRLKHLPMDMESPPQSPPLQPPQVPAYSGSPIRPTTTQSSRTAPAPSTYETRYQPSPPDSAYASIKGSSHSTAPPKARPISGLGPLPFENQVLNSLRAAKPVEDVAGARGGSVSGSGAGSVSGAEGERRSLTSMKSRGSGIRSLFRTKWKASKSAVSAA